MLLYVVRCCWMLLDVGQLVGGTESVGTVVCVVVRSSQLRDKVRRVGVEDLQLSLDYQEREFHFAGFWECRRTPPRALHPM